MHIDLRYLGALFVNCIVDAYCSFFRKQSSALEQHKHILMVRLDAIGDFVLWLDAAKAMREMYPPSKYQIVLAGNSQWVELAKTVPYFDEIIELDRKRLFSDIKYRCKMWVQIRKRHYHLVVNPTYSRDFNIDDSVIRISRSCRRIGFVGDITNQPAWKKKISDRWYTDLVEVPTDYVLMELERNAYLIRYLGNKSFRFGIPHMDWSSDNEIHNDNYIVVVPCASSPVKQWPAQRFVELLQLIRNASLVTIVICGAPGEEATGEIIKSLAERDAKQGKIEVLAGKTSLMKYVDIIKHAKLVISNDSSAIHIAAAVGAPSICIAGGGHYGRFVPYKIEIEADTPLPIVVSHPMECFTCSYHDCRYVCEDGSARCLHSIKVEEVFAHARTFLV